MKSYEKIENFILQFDLKDANILRKCLGFTKINNRLLKCLCMVYFNLVCGHDKMVFIT